MSKKKRSANKTVTAHLSLKINDEPLDLRFDVSTSATRPVKMLPVFRSVCTTIVDWGVKRIEREGRTVSCKAGCGACCRQLVPISKIEAIEISHLVSKMPDEKQVEVRKRFGDAILKLKNAGLLEPLTADKKPVGEDFMSLGLEYFKQGIPCPFLVDESCSIHPERPLICREYLVVSPAENCSRTNGLPIEVIRMPLEASKSLTAMSDEGSQEFTNWIPLVLALEWASKNPDHSAALPGTEYATKFVNNLTRGNLDRDQTISPTRSYS